VSVAENLRSVRARIARTGRDPASVAIVAVTKGFGPEACREALEAGLTMLGENRVQEALKKMDEVTGAGRPQGTLLPDWHLIGHLQSNKIRPAAGRFKLIQSVDSVRLAEQIARVTPAQQVLVEVNVAREPQKSGAAPDEALAVVRGVSGLLDVRGLMCLGPTHGDPLSAFTELRAVRDEAQERLGRELPILSMGMSGDFEVALAAGSTMLRLGQVLFGPRPA
jgi:pyridoxal phosphate enzyme (YggS family)